jgi:hypothetical protein
MRRTPWRRERSAAPEGQERRFSPVRNPAPMQTYEKSMLGQHDPTSHTSPNTTPRRAPWRRPRRKVAKGKMAPIVAEKRRRLPR